MHRGAALVVLLALLGTSVRAGEANDRSHVPEFFDPNVRLPKPETNAVKSIRFLTTDDFPPFHFALPDGTLAGFDIDLARAVCADLQLTCTIQARRFDTLVAQLKAGHDDALIAAVANTPDSRKDLDFTAPYYKTPARFVVKGNTALVATPEALAGHQLGVEAGTAHAAYLAAFFPKSAVKTYASQADLRTALQSGAVEAVFGDGITLALWLNGAESNACCSFLGGPFTESRYFGNGVSIAVAKGNTALRQALDYELVQLAKNGTYTDLYLKYFPIGAY